MKSFRWLLFLALTVQCEDGMGQGVDSSILYKLANKEPLPYVQPNGKLMGCGYTIECSHMNLTFYKILFNKKEKRLILYGRIIDPISSKDDTVGVYSFIALARPNGERLDSVRALQPSYSRDLKDSHEKGFPYRTGDFIIDVHFEKEDRLYFNSLAFQPIEYNIGELLKRR